MTLMVSRINGSATKVGTLYNVNSNLYLITVKIAGGTAIDLQNEDSYIDSSTQLADGILEAIVKEISPLAYWSPADNSGKIHVVMDKAINDAAELRTRIRRVSGVRTITGTTNGTVTLATSSALATMVGATVTGPGILPGTTVSSVSAGTSLTLNQAASTSVTGGEFTIGFDLSGTTVTDATSFTVA
jgi:hypothetical protein